MLCTLKIKLITSNEQFNALLETLAENIRRAAVNQPDAATA